MASKNQLADVFTMALGVDNYLRLIKKLGLINIFVASVEFPEPVLETQTTRALLLRGVLKLMKFAQDLRIYLLRLVQDNSLIVVQASRAKRWFVALLMLVQA